MKAARDLVCSGAKEKNGALPVACIARQPPSLFVSAGSFSVDCDFSNVWQFKHPEELSSVFPNSALGCLAPAGISSDFCCREKRNAARRCASTSLNLKFGMRIQA